MSRAENNMLKTLRLYFHGESGIVQELDYLEWINFVEKILGCLLDNITFEWRLHLHNSLA